MLADLCGCDVGADGGGCDDLFGCFVVLLQVVGQSGPNGACVMKMEHSIETATVTYTTLDPHSVLETTLSTETVYTMKSQVHFEPSFHLPH